MNHLPYPHGRACWMIVFLWAIVFLPLTGTLRAAVEPEPHAEARALSALQTEKAQNALIEALGNRAEYRTRVILVCCGVFFFVGAFCGYWAQNHYRNPVVWFFAGFVFSVAALAAIAWIHYRGRRRRSYRRVMAYWHF